MESVQRRHPLATAGLYLVLTAYFAIGLIPFAWIVLTSLKKPADVIAAPVQLVFTPTLENYAAVLFNVYASDSVLGKVYADIPHAFLNSLLIAGGATLLALVLGNFAAFALARFALPEREYYAFFFLAFRFCPVFVFIIPTFLIYQQLSLYNTHIGLILIYQLLAVPLIVWVMRSFYESIPEEIFESAAVDGASRMDILRKMALPLAAPGIAATAVLAFIECWNNFTFPLLLGARETQTVTLATVTFIGYEEVAWGMMTAAAVVTLLPELVLALIVQRYIVRGITYGAVKG
jgi:multiple sugar transport system permease protein